ncbi:Interferon regulatory factor 5 [Merluccius polli]|uniref:Interferon regulatory factor 5 n=1 Tax=Merluccius polli TaxID=89951 RepID=A0AA47P5I9_MERPO|nr:Interferon regulatory factor 5 [Merluccius polli]
MMATGGAGHWCWRPGRLPLLRSSAMSNQARRIRLKPWLLAQVNGGRYPGLQWLRQEPRLFQIPWRHATRHMPMSEEENTIFKAWALETGKYQEGVDEPDPAKWKANLRCALNKSREFKLVYDGTKETPVKPFKIYEVCDQPSNGDTVDEDEEEMPNIVGLTIEPSASDVSSFLHFHTEMVHYSPPLNGSFVPAHVLPMPLLPDAAQPGPPGGLLIMKRECPRAQQLQMAAAAAADPADFVDFARTHAARGLPNGLGALGGPGPALTEMPPMPSPAAAAAASAAPPPEAMGMDAGPVPMDTCSMPGMETQGEAQAQYCKYDLLSSLPLTDLDLKFQYRGRTARSQTVSNPQGCRLYYGHLEATLGQVDLFGPVALQQVLFPGTAEMQNAKQKLYTDALLDVMDRGLTLEISEQDIYAVRLCQCKVYWSGPGVSEHGPPNPMERERKIKVFSLNQFLDGLIMFHKGAAPSPPPFEVYFCFGEDWPDTKPKEKKLIVVQVVPVVARILTEMFSGELSWSMDSIRLQISNPDVKDQTVEKFKELQRLLQSQHAQGQWGPHVQ